MDVQIKRSKRKRYEKREVSTLKAIIIIYLLLIHVFVGIAILKTDIISRLQVKLGHEVIRAELTPLYHTMLAFHRRVDENIPDQSILFIGDSLTQGLAVTAVYPKSVNLGIGQDTTVGVLKRIPFYHSIPRSKMIIIAIGVNDLKRRDNDEIVNNFLKIINLIPNNIPILLSAIFPVDEIASGRVGINDRIRRLNGSLNTICRSSQRLHFLDISKLVTDANGNLSVDYHIGDGVHLNGMGNSIWISQLRAHGQEVVEILDVLNGY